MLCSLNNEHNNHTQLETSVLYCELNIVDNDVVNLGGETVDLCIFKIKVIFNTNIKRVDQL